METQKEQFKIRKSFLKDLRATIIIAVILIALFLLFLYTKLDGWA